MAYVMPGSAAEGRSRSTGLLLVVLLAGAAVAVFLGVYASAHTPAARPTLGFPNAAAMLAFKSWMTTLAIVFAVFQLLSALRLRDRLPWPRQVPLWLTDVHRLTGTLAVVCSLPVAYHCLWSLGFDFTDAPLRQPRVFIHALAGCFFYGAFVTKMLTVRIDRVQRWLVPVAGGAVFTLFVVVWLTSAVYYLAGRIP
jgi:hypothetical protein